MSLLSDCNPKRLADVIAGKLDPSSQSALEFHIESCISCQKSLELIAAEQNEWEKISDYFSADELANQPTHSASLHPTVDIQLIRNQDSNAKYEVLDGPEQWQPNHSEILEPASHPEMLGRIDGFEVEQMIGRGGMGIVYKGFDSELNRPVAIKVLADHLAANGVARQRFVREARAAAAVIHPNVVPIHSVNPSAKRPYLVMTLVSGRSLQSHVAENGPLNVKDIVRIGKQIAAGLSAAHREGLVHRDIKPANILLEKDVSRVMITDFGLARAADDAAITQTGWLAGTPHYMSPEQASGKEVDQRSDLFSLGSVLYFMATGREPFRAEIPIAVLQKIISSHPDPIRSVNSDNTKTLCNVIERLMEKSAEHRFQTAEEAENVLTQYLAHLEQPRSQPKPKVKKLNHPSRTKWILGMATVAITCFAAWNWSLATQSNNSKINENMNRPQPSWPQGLQSPDSWLSDADQLSKDIQQLESSAAFHSDARYDDSSTEQLQALDLEIQQLEHRFGRPLEGN